METRGRQLRQANIVEMFERMLSRSHLQQVVVNHTNAEMQTRGSSRNVDPGLGSNNGSDDSQNEIDESDDTEDGGGPSLQERIVEGNVGPGLRAWIYRRAVKSANVFLHENSVL
ncbi:hypothetical protein BC830DRAFT_1090204 [Chytriomyces sp. MP71]|nr:hypothetical protein BC830DRAFT_1090204 [Chytriomyces sp. MP71]